MCGRYSLSTARQELEVQLGRSIPADYVPRYNIAPTQKALVILPERHGGQVEQMLWGLVPHWSKDGKPSGRLINARAEGISSKPSFRLPVRHNRCLIPADSFYEWISHDKRKIPLRIKAVDNKPLLMAGIFDNWERDGRRLRTFSIITCSPNAEMEAWHNRMPVIFTNTDVQEMWLEETDLHLALDLLQPAQDGSLEAYRVSTAVNKPVNDSPDLHVEVSGDQDATQTSLFED